MKRQVIRRAVIQDIPELMRLEKICFKSDLFSRSQYRHLILATSADVWQIESTHHIIACAVMLYRKNSKIARLYSIAVDPHYRQQGLAQQLCAHIEKQCKKKQITEIRLEVRKDNRNALRFYKKIHYQPLGEYRQFYEDGEDALRLHKLLKQCGIETT